MECGHGNNKEDFIVAVFFLNVPNLLIQFLAFFWGGGGGGGLGEVSGSVKIMILHQHLIGNARE